MGSLESHYAYTHQEVSFLQVGVGVQFREDGELEATIVERLSGTHRNQVTRKVLTIEIHRFCVWLALVVGLAFILALSCTLEGCYANLCLNVNVTNVERHREFDIG